MASTDPEENERESPWSRLIPDVLSMVCHRLCLSDVPCFGTVCKHWNSCAFPVYPADVTPVLISNTVTESGMIRFYSPYFNKMFIVSTPLKAPESTIFSAAASGCVILRRPDKTVLFGSLLDGTTFETYEYKYDYGYFCACRGDGTGHLNLCEIISIYASSFIVKVQSWNGESWKYFGGSDDEDEDDSDSDSDSSDSDEAEEVEEEEEKEENDDNGGRQFFMSCCSPVLHKGLWYCLGGGGSLGVYDAKKTEWSILPKPSSFGSEFPHKNCYLVESGRELLAVLAGINGTPIYVLRLNETEMTWERKESLGRGAIFTGTVASVSISNPPEAMANKVYLPRFYGRPQVIRAELAISEGRLFFVPRQKERQHSGSNEPADTMMREHGAGGDKDGAWCYDLELDSGIDKQIYGCKNLLQYIWVHLGHVSP